MYRTGLDQMSVHVSHTRLSSGFIEAFSTFTLLTHHAVIMRRSISSCTPAVHLSERARYSAGVVFIIVAERSQVTSFSLLSVRPSLVLGIKACDWSSCLERECTEKQARAHAVKVDVRYICVI